MRDAYGHVTIGICGGVAAAAAPEATGATMAPMIAMVAKDRHGGNHPPAKKSDTKPCPFSAAAQMTIPGHAHIAMPAPHHEAGQGKSASPLTGIFPAGLPPATGPPTRA